MMGFNARPFQSLTNDDDPSRQKSCAGEDVPWSFGLLCAKLPKGFSSTRIYERRTNRWQRWIYERKGSL